MTHIGSRTDLSTHLQWQFNFLRPQFPLCGDNAYTGHVVDSHKLRVAPMITKQMFIRSLNLERYWLGPRSQEVGGGKLYLLALHCQDQYDSALLQAALRAILIF